MQTCGNMSLSLWFISDFLVSTKCKVIFAAASFRNSYGRFFKPAWCSNFSKLSDGLVNTQYSRFHRNVSAGLHCHCEIVTWTFLDLAATSSSHFCLFCFYTFYRTTWISSTLVKWRSPFCPYFFINKRNKAAIFSSQKGRTTCDCHLLECIIYPHRRRGRHFTGGGRKKICPENNNLP